jgi:S1-C subfamily serine protease
MKLCALAFLFVCSAVYCQNLQQPITQVEACRNFRASIVQVDSDTLHGTGFIVAPDGWIMTALHVVADPQTLTKRENIVVSIIGHAHTIPAEIASPLDNLARLRDFAILKIDESKLPALDLGSEVEVEDGSPIAIVGLPLSAALSIPAGSPIPRFCLSGTIAAQTAFQIKGLDFLHTIYFQGVSVKGISGAPIVSLQTGKVIGIVSTRLTGISQGLDQARTSYTSFQSSMQAAMILSGVDVGKAVIGLIDTLDQQLANGLGSGTGASDAANVLKQAQDDYKRHHPKNQQH